MVAEVVGDTPHELIRPWVDADTLHLKICVADDQGGNYGIGAYVGNGETGNRAIRVAPFIQRHACTNSIIWVEGGWEQRHYRVTPAFIFGAIKEKLGQAIGMATELLEHLVRAEMDKIDDFGVMVERLCKEKGLNQGTRDLVLMGSERAQTRLGLVNGLSYAAHQVGDPELAIDLESMAGAILVGRNSLFSTRDYAER